MKKTLYQDIFARLILAFMFILFLLSIPLTMEDGQAFATTPTSQGEFSERNPQPNPNLIQTVGWSDNFDSYATGSSLHGQGGWKGWLNNPALTAYTTAAHALSTPNSVNISAAADLVHEYSGYTAGAWVYTASQYIPSDFSGQSYFLLLNQYDDSATNLNWSVQVTFDSGTNHVINDGVSGGALPLIKDAWVELRLEIDLTHDISSFYYGDQLLYQGSWSGQVSGGGVTNIAALDLYANNASPIYYDEFSLSPKLGWSDNFDSYATGSSLHGQGGWKGWQNDPTATAYTTAVHALSTPNSVNISGTADLVHEYFGYTAGTWVYTAWQYIPTGFTGQSYFIMMNRYFDAGTDGNWSVQLNFNSTTNQVVNDGVSGGALPLIKDTWVELRLEIDLTHDTSSFYYGDQLLYQGSWSGQVSGGGITNIAAVDLFANGATAIYYDDLSLSPKLYQLYLPLIMK